jgi:(2Fe-2S) ferredoxin
MNTEFQKYQQVNAEDLHRIANEVLTTENSNTLWYLSDNQ